jgi:hypothetical protein
MSVVVWMDDVAFVGTGTDSYRLAATWARAEQMASAQAGG